MSLGIGSCVGTGMYLVSGMVARTIAGPAVVLSYAVAGFAALLSGIYTTLHTIVFLMLRDNSGLIKILYSRPLLC